MPLNFDNAVPPLNSNKAATSANPETTASAPTTPDAGELDDASFQAALGSLLSEIDTLPQDDQRRLHAAASATRQRHEQLKHTIGKLQETLDFLRMSVKYLVFDLEATRRENTYLRRMLDEATGED